MYKDNMLYTDKIIPKIDEKYKRIPISIISLVLFMSCWIQGQI